jgi:hypothetical protein
MDKNRLRLSVLAGREFRGPRNGLRYFANCNFSTSGVESLADDFDVRKGPVSSRVALLLRSAEGKPYFASISSVASHSPRQRMWELRRGSVGGSRACFRAGVLVSGRSGWPLRGLAASAASADFSFFFKGKRQDFWSGRFSRTCFFFFAFYLCCAEGAEGKNSKGGSPWG